MSQINAAKVLQTCTKPAITEAIDFFGISSITSKDIAGAFSSKTQLPREKLSSKYAPLQVSRSKLQKEETTQNYNHASVRYDVDNVPKQHGQFESSNERPLYETVEIKQRYVPVDNQPDDNANEDDEQFRPHDIPGYREPYLIADVKATFSLEEILRLFKYEKSLEEVAEYSNRPPLWFKFEKQMPTTILPETTRRTTKATISNASQTSSESLDTSKSNNDRERDRMIMLESSEEPYQTDKFEPEEMEISNPIVHNDEFDKSIEEKYDIKYNKPIKALDYLKKVRAGRIEPTAKGLKHRLQTERPYSFKPAIKLDSHGFRNYTYQVPDWSTARRVDVLNFIKGSILYNNYDILAINKPYGISSHCDNEKKDPFDINDLVQEITKEMNLKAHLAHRLDKTTTGILLFATSQERANTLNKLFKSDQIKKTYWCITRGVPDPEEAIIDIPIGEFKVAGKIRSCVVPEGIDDKRQLAKKHREARRAITEYKVVERTKHSALVEVKPKSGVKHQIRCHLGFGLNRPILGDHKYSNVTSIVPQSLPVPMLNALHLRQAKTRTLPIHLHAKSIVIPGAKANGETLFISAPLPAHFIENAKALGLMTGRVKYEAE